MPDTTPEAILYRLFVMRTDTYAKHVASGGYVRESTPLTIETVRQHLTGALCLGAYQLRDTKVKWICIDIDGANGSAENAREATLAISRTCAHFGLIPYVERSGGKGWHVWLFTHVIDAELAQRVGRGIIEEVPEEVRSACSEVVCFPKQTNATDGYGNLVKLPWGKRADNGRWGVFVDPDSLSKLTKDEQLAVLDAVQPHTEEELLELVQTNGWAEERRERQGTSSSPGSLISRGPSYRGDLPCYETLIDLESDARISSGSRNNVLFAFTSQQKRKGSSERVALRDIVMLNRERCTPALDEKEVRTIVTSCYKSDDSSAGCDVIQKAHLCPALHGVLCPIYAKVESKRETQRQALNSTDEDRLTLQPLLIMRTEPPIYTATVRGRQLQLSLKELMTYRLFKERCVSELDFVPELPFIPSDKDPKKPVPQTAAWERIVNEALKSLQEQAQPPEDASPRGAAWAEIRAFLTEGSISEHRADVFKGLVVLDEIDGIDCYLFRGSDLRNRFKLLRIDDLPLSQVWKLIHDRGGKSGTVDVPGHGKPYLWRVPKSCIELPPCEEVKEESAPPLGLLQ